MTKPLVVALILAGIASVATAGTVAPFSPAVRAAPVTHAAPMIAVTPAIAPGGAAPSVSVASAAPVAVLSAARVGAPMSAPPDGTPGISISRDSKPVVQGPKAQPPATPALAASDPASALVNPFNGKPLSQDQLQLELERSKYTTQLLEEQLKQTNALEEIKNVPGRKAVEAAQFRTAEKKEEAAVKDIENNMKTAKVAFEPAAAPKPVKKSAKALAKERAEAAAAAKRQADDAAARAAAIPPAELVSVMLVGSSRAVVIEVNGAVATIADGDQSPVGAVHILDSSSASIGGRVYKVHAQTLSRFVMSDTKPVVAAGAMGAPSGANVTSLPPAIPPGSSAALPPPPIPGLTAGTAMTGASRVTTALSGPGQNGIPPIGQ